MLHNKSTTFTGTTGIVLCLALTALVAEPAFAVISNASFQLRISESEEYLATGGMKPQLGVDSMYFRNTPFLELKNTALNAAITEFRITIGDGAFHFGNRLFTDYVLLGQKPGSAPAGLRLDGNIEDGGNELVVSFLNGGLAPGELVRFQFDIDKDSDPTKGAYDYRHVLFDGGGIQKYGTSPHGFSEVDNANVSAEFFMPGMDPLTLGPFAFKDPEAAVGPYTDGNMFAHYALSTQIDPPAVFVLETTAVIPEPSSLLLVVVGAGVIALICMTGAGRRRMARVEVVDFRTNVR